MEAGPTHVGRGCGPAQPGGTGAVALFQQFSGEASVVRMLEELFAAEPGGPELTLLRTVAVVAGRPIQVVESSARATTPEVVLACRAADKRVGGGGKLAAAVGTRLLQSQAALGAELMLWVLYGFLALWASGGHRG